MTDQADISPQATAYLERVLTLAEEQSVRRDQIDWATVRRDAFKAAAGAVHIADVYPTIDAMLVGLDDRHSVLIRPDQMQLIRGGLAATTGIVATRHGVVARVFPGSPAERIGIQAGDRIVSVDGVDVEHFDHRQLRIALRAPTVAVTIRKRETGTLIQHDLRSEPVPVVTMPSGRLLPSGIGYLDISETLLRDDAAVGYATTVHRHIAELELAGARGWVVDLRRNEGGNMWPMLAGVGPILGDGVLGSFVAPSWSCVWSYRNGAAFLGEDAWTQVSAPYRLARPNSPVAVLTSELTMSSGELTLLAFIGRPKTRIFGDPTYGVPTSNSDTVLEDGAMLLLTTSLGADRGGQTYDGPINPDTWIPVDWARLGAEDDPVLGAAQEWLRIQFTS